MKKFFPKGEFSNIVLLFLIWRLFLFLSLVLALIYFPLYSPHLLGGGRINYQQFPYIFSWGNFDGEHFSAIATYGYRYLEHAFFPVYPIMISIFLKVLPNSLFFANIVGLLISNIAFLIGLQILYKLVKIDYETPIAFDVIIILLLFPTSFFFGSVYSESIFFLLCIWAFYCARKGNFLLASLISAVASATRVFGILMFFSLAIEAYTQKRFLKDYLWILISPLGLLMYMIYLAQTVNDPLAFYNLQLIVGEQHQRGIVLFPQIIFRYLKILISLNPISTFFQTSLLELTTAIIFLILPIIGFVKRMRPSYLFYSFFGMILPTIQGSFSSLPRYVLVLFPSFIILGLTLRSLPWKLKILLALICLILLFFETALFVRGYWVA